MDYRAYGVTSAQELAALIGDLQCENALLKSQEGTLAAKLRNIEYERDKYKSDIDNYKKKADAAEFKARRCSERSELEAQQRLMAIKQMEAMQRVLESATSGTRSPSSSTTADADAVHRIERELQNVMKNASIERSEKDAHIRKLEEELNNAKTEHTSVSSRLQALQDELSVIKAKMSDDSVRHRTEVDLLERSIACDIPSSPFRKKRAVELISDQPSTTCVKCQEYLDRINELEVRVTEAEKYAAEMQTRVNSGEYNESKTKVTYIQ